MRDESLFPLFADVTRLNGIGEKTALALEKLTGGKRVLDLLFHLPVRWLDRRPVPSISELEPDMIATVRGMVQSHMASKHRSQPYRIRLMDESGFLTIAYFNGNIPYLSRLFPMDEEVVVSGKVEEFRAERQILHPEYAVPIDKIDEIPIVEPVYPLTSGLTNRKIADFQKSAIEDLFHLPEWLSESLTAHEHWPGFRGALEVMHVPKVYDEVAWEKAHERLAFDEVLARAIRLEERKAENRSHKTKAFGISDDLKRNFQSALPFEPTGAQYRAMKDISEDVGVTQPMQRMIQGDVGSGKTLIAAYAVYLAVKNGFQAALMAPTEVLALQLYESMTEFLEPFGFNIRFLGGRVTGKAREQLLMDILSGTADVVVGTHALFQEGVSFKRLQLVVVDEQHRFGVNDRGRLMAKGENPHYIAMSATPIPRSLAMAIHGDLDLTIIDEKPPGRKPINTSVVSSARMEDVIDAIRRALARGEQVFWVCPNIDAEHSTASAVARHAALSDLLSEPVGLVHGKLSSPDKDGVLERFRQGETRLLVATTVIEVGVNIPDATIMVIEGAETFGLSQLHQLRGRVGRGSRDSFCLLIYTLDLTETARARLDVMRRTNDGFEIAELDYKMRGPGDLLGKEQSGLPRFRIFDPGKHGRLLNMAHQEAKLRAESGKTSPATDLLLELMKPVSSSDPEAPNPGAA